MTKGRKISILGCGWLGYELALFLQKKGFFIKGNSRDTETLRSLKDNGIMSFSITVKTDRLEGKQIEDFFDSDILIINIPPGRRNPNVATEHPKQIKTIIEAAQKGSIQQVIFVSSTGVYGDENRVVTEADALRPVRDSGKALAIIEKYLQTINNLQITVTRMAGLVGGDRKAGRFFAGKKDIKNGGAPINMVHRTDCIHVIYEIIRQEKWNETFNVCADKHPTRKDFYIKRAELEGFEAPHFADNEHGDFKIVSNEKVKAVLGYTFEYPNPMEFPVG